MPMCRFVVLVIAALLSLGAWGELRSGSYMGTKVILSPTTFAPTALAELQPVANQVAEAVDALIPGKPHDYPARGISCFDLAVEGAPLTTAGPLSSGESPDAQANQLRIILRGVNRPDKWRFAFQLSHELAHVKMGWQTDNYFDETLAMAVSLEVLRRLGFEGYRLEAQGTYLEFISPLAQRALAVRDWSTAKAYWRESAHLEGSRIDDRPFQTLGAALILGPGGPIKWASLLNLSSRNTCAKLIQPHTFEVCDPDWGQMRQQQPFLKRLGLR